LNSKLAQFQYFDCFNDSCMLSKALWSKESCRSTIQDSSSGYQHDLSKQIIQHVNISMTHQNNFTHQLKIGTLTLCLSKN